MLSNSNLDEDTKIIIFRKGLTHKLQDKLIGLKSKDLDELQNRTIEIADQLYRMELHSKESSHGQKNHESRDKRKFVRQRSPSPALEDTMEGVEYTGRSGKPLRMANANSQRFWISSYRSQSAAWTNLVTCCTEMGSGFQRVSP